MNKIQNRYEIEHEINHGAFGQIFKGTDHKKREHVAIKMELPGSLSSLKYEVKIINYLYTNKVRQIPSIFWYGIYEKVPCLIMTYYEYSLHDYIRKIPNISIEKINHMTYQILNILEKIHDVFVIHRDIKPHNIMIKGGEIHLIDFGLSTFYIDEKREHIPDEISENSMIGSLKFASIFLHKGHKYSRRDDLISVAYLYVYMILGGHVPWFSIDLEITKNNKEKDTFMTFIKDFDCPSFIYYLDYAYQLSYNETPNYYAIKQIFAKDI